jgi:hypothetical protein
MVIKMDPVPSQHVKDPPDLVRTGSLSLNRMLSPIDTGPADESEAFVHLNYDQHNIDVSTHRNGKIRR